MLEARTALGIVWLKKTLGFAPALFTTISQRGHSQQQSFPSVPSSSACAFPERYPELRHGTHLCAGRRRRPVGQSLRRRLSRDAACRRRTGGVARAMERGGVWWWLKKATTTAARDRFYDGIAAAGLGVWLAHGRRKTMGWPGARFLGPAGQSAGYNSSSRGLT